MTFPDKSAIRRQPALSEQLYDHLCDLVNRGMYAPGALFPSETDLANSMDVSRPVVREALTRMKHDGLLVTKKGGRSHVAIDISGLAFRIKAEEQQEDLFLTYLFELRVIIEPEAAALAADRATPKAIRNIRDKQTILQEVIDRGEDCSHESREFHRSVIEASANPHLANLVHWVESKLWTLIQTQTIGENEEQAAIIHQEHAEIVKAIEDKNSIKARQISRDHVLKAANRQKIQIKMPK